MQLAAPEQLLQEVRIAQCHVEPIDLQQLHSRALDGHPRASRCTALTGQTAGRVPPSLEREVL